MSKNRNIFKKMPHGKYLAVAIANEFGRLENELQSIMNRSNIQADEK
ncbi:hypothetical protein NAB2_0004 [Lactiplantibacillus plantarum]|uniref:Uncharacterized protein n=1 Tax=Lactiplantibacillus plantarum TaxID=1590 RepID=A0AAW3RMI5_LACPN|nr:hypothetical protein NAB2_0004 [Lactiplantibacillus plantarum]